MQTITTKYHGYTNTKGSRISATSTSGQRVVIPTGSLPEELDTKMTYSKECHKWVALQLCKKLGWTGRIVGGQTKGGYVFVFDPTGQTLMEDAAMELRQLHDYYMSNCTGGCPSLEYAQAIEGELGIKHESNIEQVSKTVRIHNAMEGN